MTVVENRRNEEEKDPAGEETTSITNNLVIKESGVKCWQSYLHEIEKELKVNPYKEYDFITYIESMLGEDKVQDFHQDNPNNSRDNSRTQRSIKKDNWKSYKKKNKVLSILILIIGYKLTILLSTKSSILPKQENYSILADNNNHF